MRKFFCCLFVSCQLLCATTAFGQDREPEYSAEVIANAILAWTGDHECGHYCTESRRDDAPDRAEYVVTFEDAYRFGEAMAEMSLVYDDVEIPFMLGLAWHESNLQRFAVGPGGECGAFQQTPRYAQPEEIREEFNLDYDQLCNWLQDPANGVYSFAVNADRWLRRTDDEWLCHYNQGHAGCNAEGLEYQGDVSRTIRRAERSLEYFEDMEEDGTLLSISSLVGNDVALFQASTIVAVALEIDIEAVHRAFESGTGVGESALLNN